MSVVRRSLITIIADVGMNFAFGYAFQPVAELSVLARAQKEKARHIS